MRGYGDIVRFFKWVFISLGVIYGGIRFYWYLSVSFYNQLVFIEVISVLMVAITILFLIKEEFDDEDF